MNINTELQHLSEMLLGQGQVEPRLGRVEAGLVMGNNWKPLHKLLINLNKKNIKNCVESKTRTISCYCNRLELCFSVNCSDSTLIIFDTINPL